jgi:hypothetical protein
MPYFIMPAEDSDFEIEPTRLSLKLREQWSMIDFIQNIPDTKILLEWEITSGNINHTGTLHNDKRTLVIDDYPAGVSEFAVWYKNVIAEKLDIFVYHDSVASLEVRITSETKVTEVRDQLEGKA